MYHKTLAYRIFNVFNHVFLALLSLLCVIPLIHVLAVSFSGKAAASANRVGLWPVDFTLDAYEKTLGNENFIQSLIISVERVVVGTSLSMLVVFLAAYALSKDERVFRGRNLYSWFFVFTMLFSGGMVPMYILIQKIHLMNTIWALIIPGLVSVWNMILLLNFFRGVPKELEEASLIDGAGHLTTLFRIYLPLSMPAIATLSLFTLVGQWNDWFSGLLYMSDYKKYPLATFLQTILVQQDMSKMNVDPKMLENISQRTVKAAQIFIGAVPVLLIYPFLQKYFVKGIVLGAVKE
ncbi:protein LplC [Paenibacillus faecis]|uniref:carbohydrate ABC transporter permease n=1 Tax=Paenibacillus TaxID=44249 RepID=UPI001B021763|nr:MULTISPECIES: carbohydrate ABC transporter permease [Paenibacillus]MCA1291439.1 carbohydrate ABC transporter permease [Paenibacillus sp. alder61]GIO84117.1 protein LplC [Paenibacillus faecis]